MTRLSPACLLAPATAALLALAAGCSQPVTPPKPAAAPAPTTDKHDHGGHDHGSHDDHAHPATLADGLVALEKAIADVAVKLASGAKDAADDVVHDIGHLLGDLEGLVEKHAGAAEVKEAGRKALAELTDCFDKLDQSLHAAEGESPTAVFASVTERIAAAMKSLAEMVAGSTASKEGT